MKRKVEPCLGRRIFFGPAAAVFLLALTALALRLWDINAVHYQFDEWLGGWHANPDPAGQGSLGAVLRQFWQNIREYVASGQTIAWSALVEMLQLICGAGVGKVRLLAALGGCFGTVIVAQEAWRATRNRAGLWAAGLMSAFSVVGIIFGQFADVYASAIFATSLQILAWFRLQARKESGLNWAWFAAAALVAQLLMYTQIWVTVACFFVTLFTSRGRRLAVLRRAILPGAAYFALSLAHLSAMLTLIPWSESYRWYMSPYYPVAPGGAGEGLLSLLLYFPGRVYDLLAYHWAAVFNPDIYRPLNLNPLAFPFLVVLISALGLRFLRKTRGGGDEIALLSLAAIGVCLAANVLLLMPFGGIRQTLFLNPILSLFYGWAVAQLSDCCSRHWKFRRLVVVICCLLPLLPFALSLPGIYRDRLPRLDLDLLANLMRKHGISELCASEQNIQILELAMRKDPRFSEIDWPGYPHPADALDADFRHSFPVLTFKYQGEPGAVHWVTREYFPPSLKRAIWVDMHISAGSRYEGEGMKRFYPDPGLVDQNGMSLEKLSELPGNAPDALHQSLYWPPNSYYLYLIQATE